MNIKFVQKGVCAPKGFNAAGVYAGFRKNKNRKDLSLIVSDVLCNAAAVYTKNKVKSAPIKVNHKHLSDGEAIAIITNSGNANTYAKNGVSISEKTCDIVAKALSSKTKKVSSEDIIVCSTGVIGYELSIEPFKKNIPILVERLSKNGSLNAAKGIMTTDTIPKHIAVKFEINGKEVYIGGMAKGSGMINPNMATMLSFITTDVKISKKMLKKALNVNIIDTYNQVSVDGDTSTNDTVCILANGLAGNKEIKTADGNFKKFCAALWEVTHYLAKELAKDGEGATKLIVCRVLNAFTKEDARKISKTVIQSELVKTAIHGEDANWGRILCAIGYTEGDFLVDDIDIYFSSKGGEI
ncbi:MAG: bifunctional glutamate N-acetyltransferase/amino-acid acetyltransferase ArgJ, partial [Clostridiales Family XIII bacterium]|nr:bifunctional glutamate N-acetyltransferase/amino-acid acetyltransferase ArgJ [Clostridiales Family XIII bacterium]